jgi:hypothetical protein
VRRAANRRSSGRGSNHTVKIVIEHTPAVGQTNSLENPQIQSTSKKAKF